MNIKNLRKETKLTQKKFAEYFEIPIRTLQDWESEKRNPPNYIVNLIIYKLKKENILKVK